MITGGARRRRNGASFYFDNFSRKYVAKIGLDPVENKAA